MNSNQTIKRLLLPYIKGIPLIGSMLVIAVIVTSRAVNYIVPKYESSAILKIENNDEGISSMNLYKDFNVFSLSNKIKTEVEILKSKELIRMVANKIDNPIRYFRVGEMRTSEMYNESPFLVDSFAISNPKIYNTPIQIHFKNDSVYEIVVNEKTLKGQNNKKLISEPISIQVSVNKEIINSKGASSLFGDFYFIIYNEQGLIGLIKSHLDIMNPDKDVPIIRISFKDEVAERAAFIVNTIAECYNSDYVGTKAKAAEKTVAFIDQQLASVSDKLYQSEIDLEKFKREYKVINTLQETDAGIKEVSQLQLNLIALKIETQAMDSILADLDNWNSIETVDMNFEAFADLTYTKVISDINILLAKRKELLLKYQPNNEKVTLIENQIYDLKTYLRNGILKSRQSLMAKVKSLEQQLYTVEQQFNDLPEREKQMVILERTFNLNQKIYNFLSEKRIEASIAQASTISFHRIIERGTIPSKPVSPNKKFLVIIAGFLSVLTAILVIYIKTNFAGKTQSRNDVEKQSAIPVIGIIPKKKQFSKNISTPFYQLINELLAQNKIKNHDSLILTSAIKNEGKSYIALNLANAFSEMGWKTLLIDFNVYNQSLTHQVDLHSARGVIHINLSNASTVQPQQLSDKLWVLPTGDINNDVIPPRVSSNLLSYINETKKDFDITIVDTPAITITNDAVLLVKEANYILHIVRTNVTKNYLLNQADTMAALYQLENINTLINGVPKAYNYNGMLSGSRFSYYNKRGIFALFNRYFNTYIR